VDFSSFYSKYLFMPLYDVFNRMLDTAQAYGNEVEVGKAVALAIEQNFVSSRADLFIATKLSDPSNAGYDNTIALVERQLNDLQTEYIDLYMLHSPLQNAELQRETWRALETLYNRGVLRSIGVSNFDQFELEVLFSSAVIKPMVVQNKLDPYHVGKQLDNRGDPLVKFARSNGIQVVAYSSLSAYPFVMRPAEDPLVRSIAVARHMTPAQVILKWAMQKGFAIIPRSSDPTRLAENINVQNLPDISSCDISLIDSLQYLISSPVCVPVYV
jgi:methylglyoxal/glyoxal reductase